MDIRRVARCLEKEVHRHSHRTAWYVQRCIFRGVNAKQFCKEVPDQALEKRGWPFLVVAVEQFHCKAWRQRHGVENPSHVMDVWPVSHPCVPCLCNPFGLQEEQIPVRRTCNDAVTRKRNVTFSGNQRIQGYLVTRHTLLPGTAKTRPPDQGLPGSRHLNANHPDRPF